MEDLNKAYRDIPALHELDLSPDGFEWIDCCDTENSIIVLMRKSASQPARPVVVALNFTPLPRYNYMVGVPHGGRWTELLNSDATLYGGSGQGNMGGVDAAPIRGLHHGSNEIGDVDRDRSQHRGALEFPPADARQAQRSDTDLVGAETAHEKTGVGALLDGAGQIDDYGPGLVA